MTKIVNLQVMMITTVLYAVPLSLFAQTSDMEARFRACASVVDNGQRLSCYDQILIPEKVSDQPALSATSENREIPESDVASQPQASVAKEKPSTTEAFGLKQKLPREGLSITVTVKGIRKNLTDRFVYTTEDNQVWVQSDTRRVHYDEVPFVAEIRTATMGSFYLKPKSNGVSVRVRREK